ncbi:MAG: hypothetical protein JWP65_2516 [Ramlibacter sp.]|jgi:hypothetical protein|uniref:hypothetical protein n=1 Tax=Ramlibacter sp. TaxID=1917967 RepID=UPI00260F1326|nr:hypothetical protein [Ramlibacter sp.]MDB5752095.1 hypothetical protein [Ramlibacter sp.]
MTACSQLHETPRRMARVARSYWRCGKCGANHALDVPQCTECGGSDAPHAPPRSLAPGPRHWLTLIATWAAATALWAIASALFFASRS